MVCSDGIHHALIVDLIIYPKYQGNGIGSEILKRLLKVCTEKNIRDIQLFSATGKSKFYEKYGFQKRNENSPGMEYVYWKSLRTTMAIINTGFGAQPKIKHF